MRLFFSTFLSATVLSLALMPGLSAAQVELGAREGGFQLVVDGAPFIVHGAGGDASKKRGFRLSCGSGTSRRPA